MKLSLLLALFSFAFSENSIAKPIEKVVWLTTTQVTSEQVQKAQKAASNTNFNYFKVDESEKLRAYFEGQFPKKLNDRPEVEKDAYLNKHIIPRIKAYAPEMMRSEIGITMAKMYRIERIPAVIINDKYVTYGLSVKDSIDMYYAQGK
ncbi:DUF1525 domain-containing protein [Vibrio sp. THAF190c]|jgi:hypothetical protein|uniref:DUF1525 domain-containing protein n=1 Tax=Vibrio sp. THAF190c TaxID=2587865 RepID=UPI00126959B2|nr:DUF1525 domain-containing protein [Vibrio sp. THAF190c]QFT13413.1 hypothetical protein FIV04_26020 [Vibrio sp. THAF190c]